MFLTVFGGLNLQDVDIEYSNNGWLIQFQSYVYTEENKTRRIKMFTKAQMNANR